MEIIGAATLIPISGPILAQGGMAIEDGKICEIGPFATLEQRFPEVKKQYFDQHVLMPGLVNAHTHLEFCRYPTPAPSSSYAKWLLDQHAHLNNTSHEFIRSAISQGVDEAIESGTTCIADMSGFDATASILEDKRIRAIAFTSISGLDSEKGQDRYQSALAAIEEAQETHHDLVQIGIAPYAPFVLSRQFLKIISHYACQSKVPVQIHAAQTFHEMEFFFDSKGDIADNLFPNIGWTDELPLPHQRTPIQYLHMIDFLNCRPMLVSPVHLAPSDIELVAKTAAKIVHCPRSSAYLHEGPAPLKACLEAGIPMGLGTDGRASVDTLSLWDEMRFCLRLYAGSRHAESRYTGSRSPLTADDVLELATLGSATVLGLSEKIGSLEPGKDADYIVVARKAGRTLSSDEEIVSELIQNTQTTDIVRTVVNGQLLMERPKISPLPLGRG